MNDKKTKSISADKIRTVKITLNSPLTDSEMDDIFQFNQLIRAKELTIKVEDDIFSADLYLFDPENLWQRILIVLKVSKNDKFPDNLKEHPLVLLYNEILTVKSYGIKTGKNLYTGYADDRKVNGRKEKKNSRGSTFYAPESKFLRFRNEIPNIFENKIISGDSEEILAKLPDNCVDIIITSPPYNFGLNYESNPDDISWTEYLNKLYRIFDECIRVLSWGGRIIVNVQPLFSDYVPLHHLISSYFMSRKMIWKGEVLWEKNNYNCKYTSWGSWKSPSSPFLKYTWEFIEIFCKGDLKKSGEKTDIDITADEFKNWVLAKWSIAPERRMKEFDHPSMFPEELVRRCLKLFSYRGDVILDPFNGVGTTSYVAAKEGRRYLGIDVSEKYCRIAESRINSIDWETVNSINNTVEPDKTKSLSSTKESKPIGRPRKYPIIEEETEKVKKPRGRPRKNPIIDEKTKTVKKPRGRPRKNPIIDEKTETVKKPRGRPRKYPIIEEETEKVKKHRGRPRKYPIIEEEAEIVKKPRGRPRKYPIIDEEEEKVKKPRGRPRKYPNIEEETDKVKKHRGRPKKYPIIEEEAETVKKPRGRPRKYPIIEEEAKTVKKPRGRPRKYPIIEEEAKTVKKHRGRPKKNTTEAKPIKN